MSKNFFKNIRCGFCVPIVTTYCIILISTAKHQSNLENGGDPKRISFSKEKVHHMTLNEEEVTGMIKANNARLLVIDPIQAFLPENINMGGVMRMILLPLL